MDTKRSVKEELNLLINEFDDDENESVNKLNSRRNHFESVNPAYHKE